MTAKVKTKSQVDRTLQLEKARDVLKIALAGKSPRARGDEKMRLALDWVYRWGWSSSSTLEIIGGANRSGLAARLVKRGLLRSTATENGGAQKGIPAAILTLTETGQQEVESFREDLIQYERDPYRIRQDQLRHYQIAQTATANALKLKTITGFMTELESLKKSKSGIKQPDIIWYTENGRMGIEVELSAKWGRQMDQFIVSCIASLVGDPPMLNEIAIISNSPAIIKRYKNEFKIGAKVNIWKKEIKEEKIGDWKITETKTIPNSIEGKLFWKPINY